MWKYFNYLCHVHLDDKKYEYISNYPKINSTQQKAYASRLE